jgi:hypothetical protein
MLCFVLGSINCAMIHVDGLGAILGYLGCFGEVLSRQGGEETDIGFHVLSSRFYG